MKFLTGISLAFAALLGHASAHYRWEQINSNAVWEYVRESTNYNSPITLLNSTDLRCNQGGDFGTGVATLSVAAGATINFTLDIAVYHIGPTFFYMAKAPTTAAAYNGSGISWFKIAEWGPTFTSSGATWTLQQSYSAAIPKSLPSGDYLFRAEQLAIHNPWPAGTPQFYISCGQLTVTGGGSGSPSPLVAIPGHVKVTDPGYTVNVYNNFKNYTMPGPAVWTG